MLIANQIPHLFLVSFCPHILIHASSLFSLSFTLINIRLQLFTSNISSVHNLKINYKMTKSRPHQLYKIDTPFQTTSTPPGAFLSPHACWPQPPSPVPSSDPSSGIRCQSICFKFVILTPTIVVLFFLHCTTISPILFFIYMSTNFLTTTRA